MPMTNARLEGDREAVPVVSVRGLGKSFGPTRALDGVNLDFHAGQVHCVLGENGAGKSTIGKIIGGLFPADEGEVLIDGVPVQLPSVARARQAGIAMVYQELSLVPHLSVCENICLGREGRANPFSLIGRSREREECRSLLARFGLAVDLDAAAGTLPVAQQQLVEVVKGLAQRPRLLILDEPTAMLGLSEKSLLIDIIRSARDAGTAIIFVTHHVEEVVEVAGWVSLMKDGRLVESFPVTEDIDTDFVIAKLSGSGGLVVPQHRKPRLGEALVRYSGLKARHGRLASITIHAGEIVGFYGVVGCGREELAHAVVGEARLVDGEVTFRGMPHHPSSPAAAARLGISYLPSGRAANGILPNRSIRENLMLSQLKSHRAGGVLRSGSEHRAAAAQLERLQVRYQDAENAITSLSGGNQQKVLLGRCLEGEVLAVLEDPTAGVDIAAKHDIHDFIRERADAGLGVLLISSDLMEAVGVCDVIYTVIDGTIVNEYRAPTIADEPAIIADVLGGTTDQTARTGRT